MARKVSAEKITLAEHLRAISKSGGKARARGMTEEERKEFGRAGGLVGGKARAVKLSAKKRKEIAKAAATARWKQAGKKQS